MNSIGSQSAGAVPTRDAATVASAIGQAEHVRSSLMDAAAFAERLAEVLGGSLPPQGTDAKSGGPSTPVCMVDALNIQIGALQDPTVRIHEALARIERRIG